MAAQKIRADGERYATRVRTETNLKVAAINKRIFEVQAEAERYAALKLAAKREFEIEQRRLQLIKALSQNSHSIICGEMQDSPLAQLFVTHKTAELMGIKPTAPAAAKRS